PALKIKRNTQLDEFFGFALAGDHSFSGGCDRQKVAGTDGGQIGSRWPLNVHHAAAGKIALERPRSFFLDLSPRGIGNWRELTMQVIHGNSLLLRNRCRANHFSAARQKWKVQPAQPPTRTGPA